jgi:hypothetical protein
VSDWQLLSIEWLVSIRILSIRQLLSESEHDRTVGVPRWFILQQHHSDDVLGWIFLSNQQHCSLAVSVRQLLSEQRSVIARGVPGWLVLQLNNSHDLHAWNLLPHQQHRWHSMSRGQLLLEQQHVCCVVVPCRQLLPERQHDNFFGMPCWIFMQLHHSDIVQGRYLLSFEQHQRNFVSCWQLLSY